MNHITVPYFSISEISDFIRLMSCALLKCPACCNYVHHLWLNRYLFYFWRTFGATCGPKIDVNGQRAKRTMMRDTESFSDVWTDLIDLLMENCQVELYSLQERTECGYLKDSYSHLMCPILGMMYLLIIVEICYRRILDVGLNVHMADTL